MEKVAVTHYPIAGRSGRPSRMRSATLPTGARARVAALALAAVALPSLSACGAGFNSAVDKIEAPNAAGNVNGILARAVVLVKGREASSAALAGTLINRSSHNDVLTMVSLTDFAPGSPLVTLSPNIPLAAGQLLPLGAENHQPLTIPDARGIVVGDFVDVVLHFRDAGDLRLQVAAADRDRFYSELVPAGPTAPPAQADVPGRGAYGKAGPPAKAEPAATGKPSAAAASSAGHKPGKPAEPAATKAPKAPEKDKPAPTKAPAKSPAPTAQPAKPVHTESTQPSQAAAQPATAAKSAGGAQSVTGPAKADGAAARPH